MAKTRWQRLLLGIGLSLCIARAAAATVDATGAWQLTFTQQFSRPVIVSQSGTTLAIAGNFGGNRQPFLGSIDPATGAFTVSGTVTCTFSSPPTVQTSQISGTISADGTTLAGTQSIYPCIPVPISVTGTHLSATCGNGIVDPGESCDPGPAASFDGCCSTTCALAPVFNSCSDDGLDCTSDYCDGAGTCTHPPGNTGMTCRPTGPPCDAAEVCDGMSATCPPDQPTCPPADIDVNGLWRIGYAGDSGGFPPGPSYSEDVTLVQTGTSLVVGTRPPGYFDPVDRSFKISKTFPCWITSGNTGESLTGTFAADGDSFAGVAAFSVISPHFCGSAGAAASGVRISVPPCGNGVLDPGEACDPGMANSRCCSAACTIKPANIVCRPAVGACDLPETCDGVSTACPADDTDGDGLPDSCDPCTGGAAVTKPRWQSAADKLAFSGRATVADAATINPIANGVTLVAIDAANGTYLQVAVPGGALSNGTGWTSKGTGWSFVAASPVAGVVSTIKLAVKASTSVKFKVAGKSASLPPIPASGLCVRPGSWPGWNW